MDATHVATALGNIVTSCGLAAAGLWAMAMAVAPSRRSAAMPPLLAWLAGAALVALAADEGLELHDRVGRWLWDERGVAAPAPINHIDDVIVLGYLAVACLGLLVALPGLLRRPRFLLGMVAAGGLMAAGAAFDAFGTPGSATEIPEESLEAAGAVVLAIVFGREAGGMRLGRRTTVLFPRRSDRAEPA